MSGTDDRLRLLLRFFRAAISTKLLHKKIGAASNPFVARTYARLTVAAIPAAVVAWAIAWGVTKLVGDSWLPTLAALLVAGLVAMAMFLRAAAKNESARIRTLGTSLLSRVSSR